MMTELSEQELKLFLKRKTLLLEALRDNEGLRVLLFDKRNKLSLVLLSLRGVTSKSGPELEV